MNKMKPCHYIVISLIIFLFSICLIFSESNYDELESSNLNSSLVIKIGGDQNFPPYEFVDEHGEYTGFNVDILRAIALQSGMEIRFYPMPWAKACEDLKSEKIDAIQGMKVTKERQIDYDFSIEYLNNSQSIFVDIENDEINVLEDLQNKKVSIQNGDSLIPQLKQINGLSIIYTKDQESAMKKLSHKEVDAYIGNTLAGVFLMNKTGSRDTIKIIDQNLNPSKYSIAVKKGNEELLKTLNKNLKKIKSNGTYDKIYTKWFGQEPRNIFYKKILIPIFIFILFLLLGLLLFYRWNYFLKKEVSKQTSELNMLNIDLIQKNTQIEKERNFHNQILNQIPWAIVTIDTDGIISFSNVWAKKLLNSNEIKNKHYLQTNLKYIIDDPNIPVSQGEQEVFINHKKTVFKFNISLSHYPKDDYLNSIVTFQDITEEKLMEENIKTKDKLKSLGILISGIAHEIRNPLTSIKTYAELIPKKFDNENFRKTISKDIPIEIERLNLLINDLLEYSRPKPPSKEILNLSDCLDKVLNLLHNKLESEDINLKIDVSSKFNVYMDKNHLRQILINLILNAIESMNKDDKILEIQAKSMNKDITLHIKDNGRGIKKENIKNIYTPFFTTKSSGTGLGLFVVHRLLNENQGQIKFESTENQGTTCILRLKEVEDE